MLLLPNTRASLYPDAFGTVPVSELFLCLVWTFAAAAASPTAVPDQLLLSLNIISVRMSPGQVPGSGSYRIMDLSFLVPAKL